MSDRGMFDPGGVDARVARAAGRVPDRAAARPLGALLVFELWARAFIDRGAIRLRGGGGARRVSLGDRVRE